MLATDGDKTVEKIYSRFESYLEMFINEAEHFSEYGTRTFLLYIPIVREIRRPYKI